MITLKSAVDAIIPRANYVQAGTLGLKNLDEGMKLDPVIAAALSAISRASSSLERAQVVVFDSYQQALWGIKNAEAIHDRYITEVEKNHHATPDPEVVAQNKRAIAAERAAATSIESRLTTSTANSAGTRAALADGVKEANNRHRAGKPIKPAKPVKLPSGTFSDIAREARSTIAKCDVDKHNNERLLPLVEDAVGTIRAKIVALAAAGRPRFTVSALGADIDLASTDYLLLAQGQNGQVPIAQPDAPAMLAWLLEEQLADRAEAAVRERYEAGVESISNAERAKRLADIAERRLEAERIEVAAVLAAWASGDFSLGLRADTNPVAVLNLAN